MTATARTISRKKQASEQGPRPAPAPARFALTNHLTIIVLCLMTLVLKSLIFEPIGWWPLSILCLVPWILAVVGSTKAPRVYLYSYLWAAIYFLFNVRWMIPATGVGYTALALYLAVYFPLMACPIRHAARRHWPLTIVVPVVWVGAEMLRAVVASGFPWFYLSHSLYRVRFLIQISDLVGAYGVSFLIAACNGLAAAMVLLWLGRQYTSAIPEAATASPAIARGRWFVAGLFAAMSAYGIVQLNRDTSRPGPRVAILQGDFLSTVHHDALPEHEQFSEREKMAVYLDMLRAAGRHNPDLFLLPESPWLMYLNPEEREYYPLTRESYAELRRLCEEFDAPIVTGSATKFRLPHDLLAKIRVRNSASIFYPDGRELERYDKVHLVPFGEYIPFRFGRLRFLYLWLTKLMPFEGPDGLDEFSMFPGEGFHTFTMTAKSDGREYRFGIPICYEDVMPYVAREFVHGGSNRKRADFLLNISNDGWFGRGLQQPQHLAISTFRAVENRVGLARAVNTGVSAFIDPGGKIHDVVRGRTDDPWPGDAGFAVAHVMVDSRLSIYSRFGDWFAWLCAAGWLALYVDYWRCRARGTEPGVGEGAS